MAAQFNNYWRVAYPEHRYGSGVPTGVALRALTARAVKAHGGGSVAAGLARILCAHHVATRAYARALEAQPDRVACPKCGNVIESDCTLSHAQRRTTANPLGVYGCVHCTDPIGGYELPVLADKDEAPDLDGPPVYKPRPQFYRLRIPRRARDDLEAIAPHHRTAWLLLIQTWRELSFNPETET